MTQAQASRPRISASDRLGLTLFLALTLHAMVVLGVGFSPLQRSSQEALPSMDIIIANAKTFDTVEDPDFLAQIDQAGGGKASDKARPSAPVSSPAPINQHGLAEQDRPQMRSQQITVSKLFYLTQKHAEKKVTKQRQKTAQSQNQKANARQQRASKIARLQAEIRQMTIDYAKRPKTLTLTASTRKATEASYLASWVQKIEQTGNLNYPQEARANKIDGRLRMSVRLDASGEVLSVQITSSSGVSLLDEAAKRILRMAQPFAPFPDDLKEKADQIVIIRTWDFKSNRFRTKSGVS